LAESFQICWPPANVLGVAIFGPFQVKVAAEACDDPAASSGATSHA
jgi:hypothetical protein